MSESTISDTPLKKFFKTILGLIRVYFISVGVFVTLMPILVMIALAIWGGSQESQNKKISAKSNANKPIVIHIKMQGQLTSDEPSLEEQIVEKFFGGAPRVYLSDIRLALRRAAKDKNVKGLNLEIHPITGSQAAFSELRRNIAKFKESNKPVGAWLATADTNEYFLASVADSLHLSPAGEISIPGPMFQLIYMGEALRKVGVELEVVRSGKYKSLFEQFVANEPSAETKEMFGSMEENLRTYLVGSVASTRNKAEEKVRGWFKQSLYSPKAAKEDGLIDEVSFVDVEKEDFLKNLSGKKKGKKAKGDDAVYLTTREYINRSDAVEQSNLGDETKGIGLIVAEGEIGMSGASGRESNIYPAQMKKELEWALEAKEVKAVVLRVDSPGGSATASDMIWRDVARLKAKKPVIVSMGGMAASGGYYISAPATKIFSEPTTFTGSIGVIGALPKVPAFKEKYGVSFFIVTQSDRARVFNPGERATAFDKAIMETGINEMYQTFLERVADGRKMKVEKVNELAQGRVYTGIEALELGLVDELGGLDDAFASAKELGGLDAKKLYPVHQYRGEATNLSDCLKGIINLFQCLNEIDSKILIDHIMNAKVSLTAPERVVRYLDKLRDLASEEKYFAIWPGYFTIRKW